VLTEDSASVPLVHIGYHKTGSSWLQRFVFTRKARAGFWAFNKGRNGPITDLLIRPNALDFDPDAARARFSQLIRQALPRVPVVSSERLSGHAVTGGHDSKDLAERLAAVFPQARVLIVIREQGTALLSTYRQYVRAGGPWTLQQFLDPPVDVQIRVPVFDPNHFAYDRLIRAYLGLFDEENVLVLPYELLRDDPRRFVASIARFSNCTLPDGFLESLPADDRPNRGSSAAVTRAKRVLNRLVVRGDLNPAPLLPLPRAAAALRTWVESLDRFVPTQAAARMENRDREVIAAWLGDRYAGSNRSTSDLCSLDLASYGYS
jgi:hypothetical protein